MSLHLDLLISGWVVVQLSPCLVQLISGRLADVGPAKLTVQNLRSIIKHGAQDILHGKSVVSTDEDIDEILRKSKKKAERVKEILDLDDDEADARNFTVEDPSVYDIHQFEGQDFRFEPLTIQTGQTCQRFLPAI